MAPDSIVRLIADYAGFDLSSSAVRARARAKIDEYLTRNGVSHPDAYAEQLRAGRVELAGLVDALSVRETYFFRENRALDHIRYELLPELLDRLPQDQPIQVWSAGCASGEEPYSLAIIMYEAGLSHRAKIVATDVSEHALALARQARYRRWSLRDTDAETLSRYFYPDGSDQVLNYAIRRMVSIEHHNLASGSPPAALAGGEKADLILLRNVLIYFTPEVIERVTKTVSDSLAEDGWLITGACDPALDHSGLFERIGDGSVSVYRHRRSARVEPPRSISSPANPAFKPSRPELSAPTRAAFEHGCSNDEPAAAEEPPPLTEAELALAAGDYTRAISITAWFSDDPHACTLRIAALASTQGTSVALRECRQACTHHPLSAELHFFQAVMSMDAGHDEEALRSLRRTLYLNSSLAIAHFSLALVLRRTGDSRGAQHSLRNAANLCGNLDAHEVLPLSGGLTAGTLLGEIAALLRCLISAHEDTQ